MIIKEILLKTTMLTRQIYAVNFDFKTILATAWQKPTICICENKDADQLCSNCTADQHLCFRHTDSTMPILLLSKVSSF